VLIERCRYVQIANKMVLTGSSVVAPSGVSASGVGTQANPYHVDLWDRISIGVTKTTYGPNTGATNDYSNPNSYNRCEVRTSLHWNNSDRTEVDKTKPTYVFDSTTAPSKLAMQFTSVPASYDNILYGKDASSKQIVFNDYLVVRIQVWYKPTTAGKPEELIVQDEGFFYLQITNGCLKTDGKAVIP